MRKVALLLLVMSSTMVVSWAAPAPTIADLTWTGFIQTQFTQFNGDAFESDDYNTFSVERARLGLNARVNDRISGHFSVDFGQMYDSHSLLRDAFVRVNFTDQLRVDLGQFKIPFSSEVMQSSVDELFTMRSWVNIGTFGEDPRDIGVVARFSLEPDEENPWAFFAGVFNGNGPNDSDDDKCKDFILAAGKMWQFWGLHAAFMTGDRDDYYDGSYYGDYDFTRERFSIDGFYNAPNGVWGAGAQFTTGRGSVESIVSSFDNEDVEGMSIWAWLRAAPQWLIAARYQTWSPNEDSDDDVTGYDLSLIHDYDPNIRFMLNWEHGESDDSGDGDVVAFRTQIRLD